MLRRIVIRRPRIIPVIIAVNIMVFMLWVLSRIGMIAPDIMVTNFLVSWSGLEKGHYWILITSAFSHNMFLHLFLNMYVLSSFGPIVERVLGAKIFLRFYILAAIISSISHALVSKWLMASPDLPALGASGAIAGVILLFSFMFPKEKILLLGFIPMPAFSAALFFIGLDVWGLAAQTAGGGLPIGHGAHLGGAFTGILFYFLLYHKYKR